MHWTIFSIVRSQCILCNKRDWLPILHIYDKVKRDLLRYCCQLIMHAACFTLLYYFVAYSCLYSLGLWGRVKRWSKVVSLLLVAAFRTLVQSANSVVVLVRHCLSKMSLIVPCLIYSFMLANQRCLGEKVEVTFRDSCNCVCAYKWRIETSSLTILHWQHILRAPSSFYSITCLFVGFKGERYTCGQK